MSDEKPLIKGSDDTSISLVSREFKTVLSDSEIEKEILRYLPYVPRITWNRFIWEYRGLMSKNNTHWDMSYKAAKNEIDQALKKEDIVLDTNPERGQHGGVIKDEAYMDLIDRRAELHQEGKRNLMLQRYLTAGTVIYMNQHFATNKDMALFLTAESTGFVDVEDD